jgi:hypothetical protein
LTVTEQLSLAPDGEPSVHGDPVIVRPAGALTATVPDGADGEAPTSVTVTVQLASVAAGTGVAEQVTVVFVGLATVTFDEPLLVVCELVGA